MTERSFAVLAASLSASLSILGLGCVSPDTLRDDGGASDSATAAGTGGMTTGGGTGGGTATGTGGMTTGGGTGGMVVVGGQGGRTGQGGATGVGGRVVIGPTANFTDNFESGNTWISDSPTNTSLNPSSTPCGDWAVVVDPAAAANHVFQQRSTACGNSNPSWSGNGNVNWTDMRLQARVQFGADATTSTKITLGVRFFDDRTNYFIEYTNNGRVKIRARTPSTTTDVASLASAMAVPVPAGQWATIGLGISGSTLNVYLGTDRAAPPILTGTATEAIPAGGIGLGVAQGTAFFDDILVTPP